MDHQTQQDAAVASVHQAQAAANTARALHVFGVIDTSTEYLSRFDLHDFAWSTWQTFTDIDVPIPDEDIARVMARAATYLYEDAVVDFVDTHFGEHPKVIETPEAVLSWDPEHRVAIITDLRGTVPVVTVYASRVPA